MEVHGLRRVDDGEVRRHGDKAGRVPRVAQDSQAAMPGGGRSFRRRTAEFWEVWPMPAPDGELHRVLYVDGIWVARDLVVLICCSGERAVSWYMARSENSRAWSAPMSPIPAPEVVVTDGGSGFAKAVRESWPQTMVRRCLWHAFSQENRHTTSRPRLRAGMLRGLDGVGAWFEGGRIWFCGAEKLGICFIRG